MLVRTAGFMWTINPVYTHDPFERKRGAPPLRPQLGGGNRPTFEGPGRAADDSFPLSSGFQRKPGKEQDTLPMMLPERLALVRVSGEVAR
jgi:hypothetical protein